jgi:dihydroxyacetone kinase-like protein
MELYIANNELRKILDAEGVTVAKTLVGNFMTSIEMAGFSITILKLDDELKELLNAPADTPGFKQV